MSSVAIKSLPDGSQVPMDFVELVHAYHVSVTDMCKWCCINRSTIYKYFNGKVQPKNMSYQIVTNIAEYLGEYHVVVYNAMVESFERVHTFNAKSGKWE